MNTDDTNDSLQGNIIMANFNGIDFDVGVSNVLADEVLFKEVLVMFYQDHYLDGDKLQSAIQEQNYTWMLVT